MRYRPLASLCAGAALACGGGAAGDKITLRYRPPAGAAQQLAIEQETRMRFEGGPMAQLGEQHMTMRMFITQAVTGPVEGGTAVTVTFDSLDVRSPMMARGRMDQTMGQIRGMKGEMVVDDRMRVTRASFSGAPGLPADVSRQFGQRVGNASFSIPFPMQPVGVGDTWTDVTEVPLGEAAGTTESIKATTKVLVLEIRVAEGDTIVVLDLTTTMPPDPITVSREGVQATITLAGTLTGDQEFSLPRGATISGRMGGEVRMTMSGADLPGGMTMVMNQQMTLRSVGAL